jgi:hypothetical protein
MRLEAQILDSVAASLGADLVFSSPPRALRDPIKRLEIRASRLREEASEYELIVLRAEKAERESKRPAR